MKIVADKRDYKNGYKKHLAAYRVLNKSNDSKISRCLLLAYSVECGLKYKLLDMWKENSPKNIMEDENDKRREIIGSHNLQKILFALGNEGMFHFPKIKTVHKDCINPENYHQLCRYGIQIQDNDCEKEAKYEQVLVDIANWIGEEI